AREPGPGRGRQHPPGPGDQPGGGGDLRHGLRPVLTGFGRSVFFLADLHARRLQPIVGVSSSTASERRARWPGLASPVVAASNRPPATSPPELRPPHPPALPIGPILRPGSAFAHAE